MKTYSAFMCIIISVNFISAQDYHNQRFDRQRILVDVLTSGCINLDPNDPFIKIGTLLDFNDDTLKYSTVDTLFQGETEVKFYQYTNSAQICNKEGKFTAFYNGQFLYDRYGNKEELTMMKESPEPYPNYKYSNRSVILPYILKDSTYILFTPGGHIDDPAYDVPTATKISALTFKEQPDGKLKILDFTPKIIQGKFCALGTISAVRHANGRDWWIIAPERLRPKVHTFLFTPFGFTNINEQITKDTTADFSPSPQFSPDGQWYTRTNAVVISPNEIRSTVQFSKFNRCSGLFEDQITFDLEPEDTSNVVQVIFEKNSRYFYVMNFLTIYQGDIQAIDIKNSFIRIAKLHSYVKFGQHMGFGVGFLGPDDKIHVFDGQPLFYGSIINKPSERGLACDFKYEDVIYPACTSYSLGNMPNFNLGPLDGSPCDTLGLDNPLAVEKPIQEEDFKIYPVPSSNFLFGEGRVIYEDHKLRIFDITGKILYRGSSSDLKPGIDIGSYSAGVYFISLEGIGVMKIIKL